MGVWKLIWMGPGKSPGLYSISLAHIRSCQFVVRLNIMDEEFKSRGGAWM